MQKVQLGNTGITVPRLCFGTLTMSPLQAADPVDYGARVIRAALDRGLNFLDTAQAYKSYPHIRKALVGYDGDLTVVSKSGRKSFDEMWDAVEEALDEMGLDMVDVFLLHNVNSEEDLKARQGALDALLAAKEKGLIRAVGLSTHTAWMVKVANSRPEIEVVMPIINMKNIGVLDVDRHNVMGYVREAHELGKGVYAMKPLAGGHLHENSVEALQWIMARPEVHSIAVGIRNTDELEANLLIFNGEPVPEDLLARVRSHNKEIFVSYFCEGCAKCVEACANEAMAIVEGKAKADPDKCILCGYCRAACPRFAIRML